MIDIKYINLKKVTEKLNPVGFKLMKSFECVDSKEDGFTAYVPKETFDLVLSQLRSHDEKTANAILEDLGLK